MGQTDIVTHHIDTADHRPLRQTLRPHSLPHQQAITDQTKLMLEQNIFEPAASSWASNVVLVRQKDGRLRFCVNYRRLNEISRQDTYPLPRINTCLDALSGAKWFSTFDLRSGYHQVLMDEESRHKTTFVTRERTFKFRVMPFGLTGAPATFPHLIDLVMNGLNPESCRVYLDDIIVFSSDIPGYFARL